MCVYTKEKSLIGFKTKLGSEVIKHTPNSRINRWTVLCGCCNSEYFAIGTSLLSGGALLCHSCKPIFKKYGYKTLINIKFNRWTTIGRDTTYNYRHAKFICKCNCGTIRSVKLSSLLSEKSKSCGCLKIELLINPDSEDRKSDYHSRERSSKRQSLTRYIYKRDNYRCKICNSNKKLNAHHINGWHWYKDGRFEETNLITLCNKCHKNFHHKYGTKNNTKEQLSEYLNIFCIDINNILNEFNIHKQINRFEENFYKYYPIELKGI